MKLMVSGFQTFLYEKPGCGERPGPYGTPPPTAAFDVAVFVVDVPICV